MFGSRPFSDAESARTAGAREVWAVPKGHQVLDSHGCWVVLAVETGSFPSCALSDIILAAFAGLSWNLPRRCVLHSVYPFFIVLSLFRRPVSILLDLRICHFGLLPAAIGFDAQAALSFVLVICPCCHGSFVLPEVLSWMQTQDRCGSLQAEELPLGCHHFLVSYRKIAT